MAVTAQTARLSERFASTIPSNPMQADLQEVIRSKAHDLAEVLDAMVPVGREKTSALAKIEEAVFWANAGIVRGEFR